MKYTCKNILIEKKQNIAYCLYIVLNTRFNRFASNREIHEMPFSGFYADNSSSQLIRNLQYLAYWNWICNKIL